MSYAWCLMERRLLGVDEVHRDLCLPVDLEAESLHVLQATDGSAHRLGDFLGHRHVRRGAEVYVVGDEEGARADGDRAGGGVHGRRTEVGRALWRLPDLGANAFELAAAHVGEVLAVGARRGALVEEDGDAELAPHALAERAREGDAVLHRCAFERDEGDDVGGAHARMLAGVGGEIYVRSGGRNAREGRIGDRVDRRDEGDDAAVVTRVGARVEDVCPRHAGDGVADGGDDLGAAALTEVRNALDELHERSDSSGSES